MKTLLRHGTLITATDTFKADLLIDGAQIAQIGREVVAPEAQVVDVTGRYLLPGGVDVHTHLELPMMGTVSSDDFYTGHRAAAFGGTTTHIDFAIQGQGETLQQALDNWLARARPKAVIDYGFHMTITDPTEAVLAEIPRMAEQGVTTIKLLMAYKGRLQVDDTTLFKVLQTTAENGMLTLVHAENGDAIDVLVKAALARGDASPVWHALTRPDWLEGEATGRAIALATVANAPLYVVHVTCAKALDQIAYGRAHGARVMAETCVQYFHFTLEHLRRVDGAKWVCSPPFRTEADQVALWRAARDGLLHVVATDHCPFFYNGQRPIDYMGESVAIPGKELGHANFTLIPNGVPGLEDRMAVMLTSGVGWGHFDINRLVELTCTNPAKIFGLYPRKGTLAVGSDADVVVWDPYHAHTASAVTSHQRTDYNLYEGMELVGLPEKVYRRGELLVDGGRWLGQRGTGQFLARQAHAPIL